MMTTRAVLKRLADAVEAYAAERCINGDDDKAMDRVGARVDRALYAAQRHLALTAPIRKSHVQVNSQEKR